MATPEVTLTHLDEPLFDGADATKRDLIDYLEAVADRLVPQLSGRPLSVIRVRAGQHPFMQKNMPSYAPSWIQTVSVWSASSSRSVRYALCDDRATLIWFGNQRAVEYHVPLGTDPERPGYVVLDIDPPEGAAFGHAVAAALLVRQALTDSGLSGAVKTSGAKGLHIYVPVDASAADAAAATRALAARAERLDPSIATTAYIKADRGGKVFIDSTRSYGATVAAVYSPRARPGVPVSFPVAWDALASVSPGDFTVRNAAGLLGDGDPWTAALPSPQQLSAELLEEGHAIPVARVVAMHEGKRRRRAESELLGLRPAVGRYREAERGWQRDALAVLTGR
jgi:bifunctional non-homologous end joining protein LigD